jgi:hypothetical protein
MTKQELKNVIDRYCQINDIDFTNNNFMNPHMYQYDINDLEVAVNTKEKFIVDVLLISYTHDRYKGLNFHETIPVIKMIQLIRSEILKELLK